MSETMTNETKTRKTDRRTLYTRSVIKDSFLKLIEDTPYDKINVSKLCTGAEISRATFYLHYDNVDAVLDAVIDDALLFSEEGEGSFIDVINVITREGIDSFKQYDALLPACQRIADSERYHALFMEPLVSDRIIHRIAEHEHDAVIPSLMKTGRISEEDAEMIFKFILNGSFAVNRSLGWQKNDRWYRFQELITRFVNGGMENL